jgi:hypothetical protein
MGTGDVAQAVEHLPNKCEALSSNSNTTRKKKEGGKWHFNLVGNKAQWIFNLKYAYFSKIFKTGLKYSLC